jgi:hypothetical protein
MSEKRESSVAAQAKPESGIARIEVDPDDGECSLHIGSVCLGVSGRDWLTTEAGMINAGHEEACPYRAERDKAEQARDAAIAERDELAVTLEMIVDALNSGIHQHACSYCGHMIEGGRPETQAEIRAHMDQCPKHPMNQLRKANEELEDKLAHTQFEVDGMANTLARFAIDKIGLIQPTEWDDRDLYRGIEMRFNKLKKANEELIAERNALREGLREARDLLARYNRHTSLIDQQEVLRSVQMLPSDHDALMARFDDLLAGEDALTNGGDDGR